LNAPGEALTLVDGLIGSHDYFGNEKASNEKIVRNVLKQGDAYVRMGDLLQYDADGFISFSDRLGDTFRVKGHNVSTTEVEIVVRQHPKLETASVYPVKNEGMVALAFKPGLNAEERTQCVSEMAAFMEDAGLPKYMIPRYCRVVDAVDVTATFKLVKSALKAAGTQGCEVYELVSGKGYVPLESAKL
jgi:acyl-CoA synthetase (AMP-forming)/AMP-acid ligase II